MAKMIWAKQIPFVYACRNADGKMYAMADRVPQCSDICSRLQSIPNLHHANICDSYKQAKEVANLWNKIYEKNGYYLFS